MSLVLLFFGNSISEGFDEQAPTDISGNSISNNELDVIQNFLQSRATFTNSINHLIVYLSHKGKYNDLIQHLNDIKDEINNL